MPDRAQVFRSMDRDSQARMPLSEPCVMVIFGATGDLTKRLLVPALYNLACDGLLSDEFAVLGAGRSEISDAEFRERIGSGEDGLRRFHTRQAFDAPAAEALLARFHFSTADITVEDFRRLKARVSE